MSGFASRYQLLNQALRAKRLEEEKVKLEKELVELRKPKKSLLGKLAFWRKK